MASTGDMPNETVSLAAVLAKNAVRRQGELLVELAEAKAEIDRLRAALKPFADAAFNDNGDLTIDTSHIKTQDWLRAKTAIHVR